MKKLYKFPPCSIYDVPAMETWLQDLAQAGLFLQKAGRHLFVFQINQPAELSEAIWPAIRYRLEPIPDDCAKPADDMMDDYASAGWEFVASADKSFFIWRSLRPDADELHSDPWIQSTAYEQLCRRLTINTAAAVLLPAALFLIFLCGMLLSNKPVTLFLANPSMPLLIAAEAAAAMQAVRQAVTLRRFKQSLADGLPAEHYKDYKKGMRIRRISRFCLAILLLAILSTPIFVFTLNWKKTIADINRPLPYLPLDLIEQDTDFAYHTDPYIRGGVNAYSYAEYAWTLFAPVHYDIYQSGSMHSVYQNPDNGTIAVCPSAKTEYFRLSLPFLAAPLYKEQIRCYVSPSDQMVITEPAHPGFDHITVADSDRYTQLFACRGNQVIHIQYWGTAVLSDLLDELSEAFDAAKGN